MSQNDEFDVFNSDPSKYPRTRNVSPWWWVFVIGLFMGFGCSALLFLNNSPQTISQSVPTETAVPQTNTPLPTNTQAATQTAEQVMPTHTATPIKIAEKTPPNIIFDFENYESGQLLGGQDGWVARQSCNIEVVNDNGNAYVRSGSCANGQSIHRPYDFGITSETPRMSFYFRGRITAGGGGNSNALFTLSTDYEDNNETIQFGMSYGSVANYNLFLRGSNIDLALGPSLTPGEWYEFRLDVDWSYQARNGYGLGTLFYRPWGSDTLLTDPAVSNVELGISNPADLNLIWLRMDGLNNRRGEIDDIGVAIAQ